MRNYIVLMILATLLFSGCIARIGKIEKPYNGDILSQDEAQELLTHVLSKKGLNTCIKESKAAQLRHTYILSKNSVCYSVYKKKGFITSQNRSNATEYMFSRPYQPALPVYSSAFREKAEKIEAVIDTFDQDIAAYVSFKKNVWPMFNENYASKALINYEREYEKAKQKAKEVRVVIKDDKKLLPNAIRLLYEKRIGSPENSRVTRLPLDNGISLSATLRPIDLYVMSEEARNRMKSYATNSATLSKFFVCTKFTEYISIDKKRYSTSFNPEKDIKKLCEAIEPIQYLKVAKVDYNFTPTTFKLSDKFLTANFDNEKLLIQNTSGDYITVQKVSFYINEKIHTEDLKLEFPPHSKFTYEPRVNFNKFENLKSRNQEGNFGIAIGYVKAGSPENFTLYRNQAYKVE